MIPDKIRAEIAANAFCSAGSGIPTGKLFSKKTLTIGFMGGSVTQGYIALHVQPYAYPQMLADDLQQQGCAVQTVLCAEAGMNCVSANLLTDERILASHPDLVFLEFAINETTLKPSVIAFESLLRKLLTAPDPPLVCLFILRSTNGYSCEGFMTEIAEHYHLPYTILRKGLDPVLKRGDLQWQDYADEESHPNADGHRLLADCLMYLVRQLRMQPDSPALPLPEPWLDAPYTKLKMIKPDPDCPFVQTNCPVIPNPHQFYPVVWAVNAENGGLEITVSCRILAVFYLVHRLPEFGSCEIAVDGVPMKKNILQSNSIYGWGNENHVFAVQAADSGVHTVSLKPLDQNFFVLGFGICE
ncbi:MAG TPA: hypothetical protein DCG49_12540 [Ruminococcus sp.]|nr:hypothetical protein [Ruminococcus sp.]